MNRITWKHVAVGLALLATFSLLAPAPAQAAALGVSAHSAWSGGWSWVASFWNHLAGWIFGGGSGSRPHAPGAASTQTDTPSDGSNAGGYGSLINPDGGS